MKRVALGLISLSALSLGAVIASAQQEVQPESAPQTRVYIIETGDTLWDISATYLNSPWYWPRLWHVNPGIVNPHLIFPGQELRIPDLSAPLAPVAEAATAPAQQIVAGPTEAPQQFAEAPAETPEPEEVLEAPEEPSLAVEQMDTLAVESELPTLPSESRLTTAIISLPQEARYYVRVGSEGFIARDEVKAAASVVGSHSERLLYGQEDLVFISLGESSGVEVGQRFQAFGTEEKITHPETGEEVGWRTVQLGILEVTSVHRQTAAARILESYGAIEKGTLLRKFEPFEKRIFPQPSEKLRGYVVSLANDLLLAGEHSIIYVDKGKRNGVEIGQTFQIYREAEPELDVVTGRMVKLPPKILGAGIIVDTRPRTATALVWDSQDAIQRGDRIRTFPQP